MKRRSVSGGGEGRGRRGHLLTPVFINLASNGIRAMTTGTTFVVMVPMTLSTQTRHELIGLGGS